MKKVYIFGESHSIRNLEKQLSRIKGIKGKKLLLREGIYYKENERKNMHKVITGIRRKVISKLSGLKNGYFLSQLKEILNNVETLESNHYYKIKKYMELKSKCKLKGLELETDYLSPFRMLMEVHTIKAISKRMSIKTNTGLIFSTTIETALKEIRKYINGIKDKESVPLLSIIKVKVLKNYIRVFEDLKKREDAEKFYKYLDMLYLILEKESGGQEIYNIEGIFSKTVELFIKDPYLKIDYKRIINQYRSILFFEIIYKEFKEDNEHNIIIGSMGDAHSFYVIEGFREKGIKCLYENYVDKKRKPILLE